MKKQALRATKSAKSEPVINPPSDDESVASTDKEEMDVEEDSKLLPGKLVAAAVAEEKKKDIL